jgi:hypothetical protein
MLKIQMLEQIMNNENSEDEDCEQSQSNSIDESDAIQSNGQIDFYVKKRSTKR